MLDSVMFVIANIYQPIIATPAIAMVHTGRLYFSTQNALKRLFRASGTISVYTCPWRLKIPKTIVFPEAPRPRLPGIRRGPK
jgi:hypothetical protein